eukprot:359268-Chlamydomonas_euryale.AAC.2
MLSLDDVGADQIAVLLHARQVNTSWNSCNRPCNNRPCNHTRFGLVVNDGHILLQSWAFGKGGGISASSKVAH